MLGWVMKVMRMNEGMKGKNEHLWYGNGHDDDNNNNNLIIKNNNVIKIELP